MPSESSSWLRLLHTLTCDNFVIRGAYKHCVSKSILNCLMISFLSSRFDTLCDGFHVCLFIIYNIPFPFAYPHINIPIPNNIIWINSFIFYLPFSSLISLLYCILHHMSIFFLNLIFSIRVIQNTRPFTFYIIALHVIVVNSNHFNSFTIVVYTGVSITPRNHAVFRNSIPF